MASDTTVRVQVRLAGAPTSQVNTKVAMPNPLINKTAKDLLVEINRVVGAAGHPPVVQMRGAFGAAIPPDTFASTLHGKIVEVLTAAQVRAGTKVGASSSSSLLTHRSLVHQSVAPHKGAIDGSIAAAAGGSPSSKGKTHHHHTSISTGGRRSRDPTDRCLEARSEGKVPMTAPTVTALRTAKDDLQPRDPYLRVVEANADRYIAPSSAATLDSLFKSAPVQPRVHLAANSDDSPALLTTPSAMDALARARASIKPQVEGCSKEVVDQFKAEERDVQELMESEERIRALREREHNAVRHPSSLVHVGRLSGGGSVIKESSPPSAHRDALQLRNVKWHAPTPRYDPQRVPHHSNGTVPPPTTSTSQTTTTASKDPFAVKRRQFVDEWRKGYEARQKEKEDLILAEKSAEAQEARRIEAEERDRRQREEAERARKQQEFEYQLASERAKVGDAEKRAREGVEVEEESQRKSYWVAHTNTMDAHTRLMSQQRHDREDVERRAVQAMEDVSEREDITFAELLNRESNNRFQVTEALRRYKAMEGVHKASRDNVYVDYLQCQDDVMREREQGLQRLAKQMSEAQSVIKIREERAEANNGMFNEDGDAEIEVGGERVSSPIREQSRSFSPLPAAMRRRQEEEAERREREQSERKRREQRAMQSSSMAEEEEGSLNSTVGTLNRSKAKYFDEF